MSEDVRCATSKQIVHITRSTNIAWFLVLSGMKYLKFEVISTQHSINIKIVTFFIRRDENVLDGGNSHDQYQMTSMLHWHLLPIIVESISENREWRNEDASIALLEYVIISHTHKKNINKFGNSNGLSLKSIHFSHENWIARQRLFSVAVAFTRIGPQQNERYVRCSKRWNWNARRCVDRSNATRWNP